MQPSPRPRVFLDSNVIFSALYSPKGAPATIFRQFIDGKLTIVISQQVLEEVVQTLKEKLPDTIPYLRRLLINIPPEICEDPAPEEVNRWAGVINADDAGIIAAAVASQPDYLVTGDKHFFSTHAIADESGLRIVTPGQFIRACKDAWHS